MFMEHGEVEVRRSWRFFTSEVLDILQTCEIPAQTITRSQVPAQCFGLRETSPHPKRSSGGLPTEQPRLQIPSCESPNPKL